MQPNRQDLFRYHAYGLNIVSDVPFGQLQTDHRPSFETISITRVESLPDRPTDAVQIGPFAWAAPGYLSLEVSNVVHMVVQNGDLISYLPTPNVDTASIQLFLLGSGLGALLIQRDLLVMHGNAVEVDGVGMMCVGASGAGKSTTAAGLMQRGHRIMSDDVCAINMNGDIIPGIHHIKLWQDAADQLALSTDAFTRVRPELEKFGVPLGGAFCDDAMPIKSVYILSRHQSETISFETVTGHDKFLALRENSYRLPFITGMGMDGVHFRQLTNLATRVSVKKVLRPASGFHLDRLLDELVKDATQNNQPL